MFAKRSKNPKQNLYATRVDDELAALIEAECQSLNLTRSGFLEKMLKDYFDSQPCAISSNKFIAPGTNQETIKLINHFIDPATGDYYTPGIYPPGTLSIRLVELVKKEGLLGTVTYSTVAS